MATGISSCLQSYQIKTQAPNVIRAAAFKSTKIHSFHSRLLDIMKQGMYVTMVKKFKKVQI